jgi:hypothetical protein
MDGNDGSCADFQGVTGNLAGVNRDVVDSTGLMDFVREQAIPFVEK